MGIKFKIQASELGKFEKEYQSALKKEVAEAQKMVALDALHVLRWNTWKCPPASSRGGRGAVASGKFLNSWKVRYHGANTVVVENDADHAVYVEEGRRAGASPPPVDAIAAWLGRKLGVRGPAARGIAYVVARAIGRRGLQGRHIIKMSMDRILRIHSKRMSKAVDKALRKAAK